MSDADKPGPSRASLPVVADQMRDSLPGLIRVTARMWFHSAEWGVLAAAKMTRKFALAAVSPQKAMELFEELSEAAGVVGELSRAVISGVPLPQAVVDTAHENGLTDLDDLPIPQVFTGTAVPPASGGNSKGRRQPTLRDRGEHLLGRSRDVWNEEEEHPAYARILEDLAPDEARILVLMLKNGPQPSVDIRTGGPVGRLSSTLVAPGLNMIGPRAGVRYLDRVPAYLNNLNRLGLVSFSVEALRDPLDYQVVEAQPDVMEAMHSVKFPKVVRRSLHLTPFGEDFTKNALVDEETAASDALPEHHGPEAAES